MNQSKNGTLLVAVATIVTVVLILSTGRDEMTPPTHEDAVHKEAASHEGMVIKSKTVDSEVMSTSDKLAKSGVESNTAMKAKIDHDLMEIVIRGKKIAAPEGPFAMPSSDHKQAAKVTPAKNLAKSSSNQHHPLKHKNQPIWMDQKLGDFKSVEKGEVVFILMPTNTSGIQGGNPKQVVTSKNDKFTPTSIPANYNYQEMPIYNGGYYIAPMPSYLMSSKLPGKVGMHSKR